MCWVVVTTTHYHMARMRAFAHTQAVPPCIIELTNENTFSGLKVLLSDLRVVRRTVSPGVLPERIRERHVVRSLQHFLSKMKPAVVCISGWGLPGSLGAVTWCVRTCTPIILMSDSTEDDAPRIFWKEFLKRRIARLCSAALVGGTRHAAYLVGLGMAASRIFMGYDVVDND